MENELIVNFCRARERYQERQRNTAEERSETNETYKSVLSLLTESMRRNGQRCIRCVHTDGTTSYIRLVEGRRRAMVLRNPEDVIGLLQDVSSSVSHVSKEELPDAIARLVESRAKARGTEVAPRISVVPRVGVRETIIEQENTCRELQTLTSQMTQTHHDRKRIREEMAPVRREMQAAEQKLCDTVVASQEVGDSSNDASHELDEIVQMHAPQKNGNVRTKTVSISTVVKPKARNIFGLRNICKCVREAVQNVSERDERFDELLRAEMMRVLVREQEETSREWTRRVVVKRQRPTPQSSV